MAKPVQIDRDISPTKESVPEMVVRRILDLVKTGVLKAGEALPPERDLAASWNVSRPSVREAMRGLAVLGVVRTRQGGGAYISDLGPESLLAPLHFYLSLEQINIRELYDARSLIESDVARLAAVNLSDADLTKLEALWQAQVGTLTDPLLFRLSDFAFHEMIWIGAGNAFLKRIGESLNILGLEFRKRASEMPLVLEQSLRDHRVLLDALIARDPNRAAQAALSHMQNVYQSTVSQV
ncbi:MAG: FadR family transcriptional regulator [Candidatus Saccharibacteria bacterium]|nr:FadR family transcriptional regulator [Pseudorhodobacter sp.]